MVSLLLLFPFCGCNNMRFKVNSEEDIADATFNRLILAIQEKDASGIVALFSETVQGENTLAEDALSLIEFIHGDIISVSSAAEAGVGVDREKNNGKQRKEIQSSFCVITTEGKYYVAIKQCVRDDFDDNNIGVLSFNIIEASIWGKDYVYRGGGEWNQGINIAHSTD